MQETTDTCIAEEGVRCPEWHEDVLAVSTHKLLMVKKTDAVFLLQEPGPSIWSSGIVNILRLGQKGKTKPHFMLFGDIQWNTHPTLSSSEA